jgi:hypothetical protein
MNDVRPLVYAGHDAVIVRVPGHQRLVRAIVSREALETRFEAGHSQQGWVAAYLSHVDQITAVIQDKIARACPEPILISKHDF